MVDLLVRQDKMTMAHSLENRVPFLDRNLVTFARSLPGRFLVSDSITLSRKRTGGTKLILKNLARVTFDERFICRPKSGFSLPLKTYFGDARFRALMEDSLLPGMAKRGLVRPDIVKRWWKELPTSSNGLAETLWSAVALELWAQEFIDRSPSIH